MSWPCGTAERVTPGRLRAWTPDRSSLSAPTGTRRPGSGPPSPRAPATSAWPRTRCKTRSSRRSSTGPATGCPPTLAAGWPPRPAARHLTGSAATGSAGQVRAARRDRGVGLPGHRPVPRHGGRRGSRQGRRGSGPAGRRRAAQPGVRLLPPGAGHRSAGRAHPARRLRPDDRPDRGRVPGQRADDGPAPAPRAQDAQRPEGAGHHPRSRRPGRPPRPGARRSSTWYSTRATWQAPAASPPAATWPPRRSR